MDNQRIQEMFKLSKEYSLLIMLLTLNLVLWALNFRMMKKIDYKIEMIHFQLDDITEEELLWKKE